MNRILIALCLAFAPCAFIGCATTPTAQATQVRTLAATGVAAKAGMDACTQLLKAGRLSVADWQKVATIYDLQFQPAFAIAVSAAHGADINQILASPDLLALAGQIANLVATCTSR